MIEYVLSMDSKEAKEIQNALEAIMRWMLKQPEIMREYLPDRLDWKDDFDGSLKIRDAATEYLKKANNLLVPYDWKTPIKTEQWYRIYNIYQVIRHAMWEAESNKSSWCVSADEPIDFAGIGLPKIIWRKTDA